MQRSVGPYLLVEKLGEGAASVVYRAERDGRAYVVKVVAMKEADDAARLLERESRAAQRVDHPGCARVIEIGREGDALYLVREYVPGRTLASLLEDGPLPPVRAVDIAAQVLEAAGAAHRAGVVHRDLKPANVLCADDGRVLVLDFGIAYLDGSGTTISLSAGGAVVGTPEYIAPEQVLGETIDGRADIYAVGVMLYEMLSGRRPLQGETPGELLSAHIARDPEPLSQAAPNVPAALADIAMRALAKRRDDRFPDADAFRTALRGVAFSSRAGTILAAVVPPPGRRVGPASRPSAERGTVPLPPIPEDTPTPVPAAAPVPPARQKRRWLLPGALAALVAGGAAAAWFFWKSPAPPAAVDPDVSAVRAILQKGELIRARAMAEALARRQPAAAAAFHLLGDVLFLQGEKERALAAYREAVRMDPSIGVSQDLLANLRATFADPVHGEAAFRLAEEIGPPARPVIRDAAASTASIKVKRRAAEALAKIEGK